MGVNPTPLVPIDSIREETLHLGINNTKTLLEISLFNHGGGFVLASTTYALFTSRILSMESHYGCLISSVLSFLKHDFACDFHDGLFAERRYLLIMHSRSRNHALVNWVFHDLAFF